MALSTNLKSLPALIKSLADETRLRILRLLTDEELSVGEIVDALGLSQSKVSRHLAHLKESGWVDDHRDGIWIFYKLNAAARTGISHKELWQAMESHFKRLDFYPNDLKRLKAALSARKTRGKAYFEQDAERWDRIREGLVGEDTMASAMGALVNPNLRILDVGCGTGRFVSKMAGIVSQAVGLDFSPHMLEQSRKRMQETGTPQERWNLVEGDMEAMPFNDGEFDAVFGTLVLRYSSNPRRALNEFSRVLKTKGALSVTDIVKHDQEWVREKFGDQWLGFEPDDVAKWARELGFDRVDVELEPQSGESGLSLFVVRARLKQ